MERERVDDSIFNNLFRRIMENKSEREEKKRKRLIYLRYGFDQKYGVFIKLSRFNWHVIRSRLILNDKRKVQSYLNQ